MVANISNGDWVRRLRHHDQDVRDTALEDLRQLISRGLSHSLNNRNENRSVLAECVVQEALLRITKTLDDFEGRSQFTTWAMSIATQIGIRDLRRHPSVGALDGLIAGDCLGIELATDEESVERQGIDRHTIVMKLRELINSVLTDEQRLAIRGVLEGLTVEEIAARTGSNRNAIFHLVHDARVKLRKGFENSGIAVTDIVAILT